MNYLFILNGPPYGDERSYNALRLADSLARDTAHEVKVYLMGEGTVCAHRNQQLPRGHYNIELMLKTVVKYGGEIGVCEEGMDVRGIADSELVDGAHRRSLAYLTVWTADAHQVLVF